MIVMEPLRGGSLARRVPPAVQAIWDEAEVRRSPAEWALRWVWNHPEVTVALSGMNRENQVDENIRIAGEAHPESLAAGELELVRRVAEKYGSLFKAGCTGCRYCMPCPHGVDIPACFELYNSMHTFGDRAAARVMYLIRLGGLGGSGTPSLASRCQACGECAEKCPQRLPIPELLKDVAGDFEGRDFRVLSGAVKLFTALQRRLILRRARQVRNRDRKGGRRPDRTPV